MTSIAFDLGQTGLRVRIFDEEDILLEFDGEGYRRGLSLNEQLLTIAGRAAMESGIPRFESMGGGLSGIHGRVPAVTEAARRLKMDYGIDRLAVADDAVTSYLGALGEEPGVVVAVGTGLVALSRAPSGQLARVDGVGPLLGDEGAGWWIGRQGLIAAISASDGREGGSPHLLAAAQDRYGPLCEIPSAIAGAASPIAAVAAFTRDVASVARAGDSIARRIWSAASKFIGRAIAAAAERASLSPSFHYSLVGNVSLAADLLEPDLTDFLQARFKGCTQVSSHGTSLDGAAELLCLPHFDSSSTLVRDAIFTEGRPH